MCYTTSISQIKEDVDAIFARCNQGCGLYYEIFHQRFVSAITGYLSNKPEEQHPFILECANKYGYQDDEPESDIWDDIELFEEAEEYEIDDVPDGYVESGSLDRLVSIIMCQIEEHEQISPVLWTELKLLIGQCPQAIDWYHWYHFTQDFTVRGFSRIGFIHYLQFKLLDRRFAVRLDKKIANI